MNSLFSRVSFLAVGCVACLSMASFSSADTVLWSEDFSGLETDLLNTETTATGILQTGSVAWSANNWINADGSINETTQGMALLPFVADVNQVYTLTADFSANDTNAWMALGFSRDGVSNAGGDSTVRFSNGGANGRGLAWMLYRTHPTDLANDVALFAGVGTANSIADNNATIDIATAAHELEIVVDTTGDGSSFEVNYFIDGTSITFDGTAQTVSLAVSEIAFVGLSFADSTVGNPLSINSFSLSVAAVPEPTSFALLGLVSVAGLARRRRK